MLDAEGKNMIAVAPGANGQVQPDDLAPLVTAFVDTKLLILQLEIPLDTVAWAAAYAKQLGCPVLLNPAPIPPEGLPSDLLKCVNILTPNEGELLQMVPGAATLAEAAKTLLASGVSLLVVTQGGKGATVFTPDETFPMPAFPVSAVDTVGAGDCFSGALGVALAEGQSYRAAVRFASAAAALSTTLPGAQDAMPIREQIEALLAQT
jgi:ribokinase